MDDAPNGEEGGGSVDANIAEQVEATCAIKEDTRAGRR